MKQLEKCEPCKRRENEKERKKKEPIYLALAWARNKGERF